MAGMEGLLIAKQAAARNEIGILKHPMRNFLKKTLILAEVALVAVTVNACRKYIVDTLFIEGGTIKRIA